MTTWSAGGGGCTMVRLIEVPDERPWASEIVTGIVFAPRVVPVATVASRVNVFPLPASGCTKPPIDERSAVTVIPVLVGLTPGVTFTVSVVVSPTASEEGFAEPVPVGGVGLSSLTIVPVAVAVVFVAPTMLVTFTLNVSF